MRQPADAIRRRLFDWLQRGMEAERARNRRSVRAVLAETAQLGREAAIENAADDSGRVVIGHHSYLLGRLFIYGHGGAITIGDWCYVGVRSEIWSMHSIAIGNRVLIAHDVNIHDGTAHSLDAGQRHTHFRRIVEEGHPRTALQLPGVSSAPIIIEDDVWISFGVTILKGVRIGAGSVIAAGAVVTNDVPPGVLYRCEVKPVIVPLPKP